MGRLSSFGVGLLVAISTVTLAPAGTAWASSCITRTEFNRVHNGQTLSKVTSILRNKGKVEVYSSYGGYVDEDRTYTTCVSGGTADVEFSANPGQPLRVSGKTAFWGL